MTFLLNLLRIRRVEFRIAELPIFIMPVLLSLRGTAPVQTAAFWEGIVLLLFLFAFGDIINCLADRDLDATYKPHLSNAVYGLGVGFVKVQIALSALAALALAISIARQLDRPFLAWLVVAGLLLGAAYSVKPLQLKGCGVAQIPCLWTIIFVGPMILAALLVGPVIAAKVLAFALAYGALAMGVILVNTAEDYPEDLEAGIRTSIVALGLKRGIQAAYFLALFGAIAVLATLQSLYREAAVPIVGWAGLLLPLGASLYVCGGIGRLARSVAVAETPAAILLVKRAATKVPLWITLVAWSTCTATLVFYELRTS